MKVADTVPNLTAVAPVKLVPEIVTLELGSPLAGVNPVIFGNTLKLPVLVAEPAGFVMEILPDVAPAGTVALIEVADEAVKVALTPLKLTLVTPT